ncbi:hypothetical protein DVR12_18210 [Chitinophaga silvatica]|uniref:Uncharacterized protein n=1 Tax=Chitinophaga silvatica TaxID=2282649 RepID=A0A3E1Y6W7_9BACT|nr:hypothetical protein [Chitinophaga silvatica]RFS20503.1 hypothetical protein DVR12_18210 [Chitinophaga silvatica]
MQPKELLADLLSEINDSYTNINLNSKPEYILVEDTLSYKIFKSGALLHLLENSTNDISALNIIAEYLRMRGSFYNVYPESSAILELMLSTGIQLANHYILDPNDSLTPYLTTLYDIIFHQIRFEEYSLNVRKLFFQLNILILDIELLQYKNTRVYSGRMFFLSTTNFEYKSYKEEFLVLYNKYLLIENLDTKQVIRKNGKKTMNGLLMN